MPDISLRPLAASDFARWNILWAGYQDFYGVTLDEAVTERTWARFFEPGEPVHGVGRALIEATAATGRDHGSDKLYWQTHQTNTPGRALHEKVATDLGFIV